MTNFCIIAPRNNKIQLIDNEYADYERKLRKAEASLLYGLDKASSNEVLYYLKTRKNKSDLNE